MTQAEQIAKYFRELHYGGNSTGVNFKDALANVTWRQATTQVHSFHTIAEFVFHVNYYISAVLKVLQGGPLNAHDKHSFDCPPIQSQEDWEALLSKMWSDAEEFAALVEKLPDSTLWETMADEKYGNYYRNLHGIIEHSNYHLGQIVLIRKMVQKKVSG